MQKKLVFVFLVAFALLGWMAFEMTRHPILIPVFILLSILIPLSMLWYVGYGNQRKLKRLIKTGQKAQALVLKVEDTGMTLNKIHIGLRLTLRLPDQTQVTTEIFVSRVNLPRSGDVVEVVYDPKNPSHVALVTE